MAKKQKRTANQIAFQKERKRLLQAKRRAEKRGYTFEEGVIPELPKRVTKKALERIQATKPAELYKRATYTITTDIEGMEKITTTMSGEEGRAFERQLARNKAKRTRERRKAEQERQRQLEDRIEQEYQEEYYPTFTVIDRVRSMITGMLQPQVYRRGTRGLIDYPIENRKNALLQIFEDSITFYGEETYEEYLTEHIEEISEAIDSVQYKASTTEQVDASFGRIGKLLNVTSLTQDQGESLSAMSELY